MKQDTLTEHTRTRMTKLCVMKQRDTTGVSSAEKFVIKLNHSYYLSINPWILQLSAVCFCLLLLLVR